jgi:hypothetical protein
MSALAGGQRRYAFTAKCVLILLHILLHVCPHTTIYVPICVKMRTHDECIGRWSKTLRIGNTLLVCAVFSY